MKFVQEYCSICQKEQAMPVVQEEEDSYPGLIWVRCPTCQEIKPLETGEKTNGAEKLETGGSQEGKEKGKASRTSSGESLGEGGSARRVVRQYRSGERFSLGEWIYHPGWDDTGQVIEKHRSRGGHEIIVVSFARMGTRRLISNFAS